MNNLKGHIESIARLKNLDFEKIQKAHTIEQTNRRQLMQFTIKGSQFYYIFIFFLEVVF